MHDVMVSCKKCGNKVPASYLKLDLDEKMVICPDCIKNKKIHKEVEKEVFHKNDEAKKSVKQIFLPEEESKTNKIGHKCTSCGYKFVINPKTRNPKCCPYCNARIMSI